MRLIDADILKDNKMMHKVFINLTDELYGMLQLIDEQPTVNVVKVVRCKDYCFKETSECVRRFPQQVLRNEKEEFCSYGKRKDVK